MVAADATTAARAKSAFAGGRSWDHALFAAVVLALFGSAVLIDPFADAAFDAPKRFAVTGAAIIAAALLIWRMEVPAWRHWSRPAQVVLVCVGVLATALLVSTITATHAPIAWAALRTLALLAVFLWVGASRLLAGDLAVNVWRLAAIAVALNALLSLAQALGVALPIPVVQLGGRLASTALLGNEGYVALASALMAAAAFAFALTTTQRQPRLIAIGLFLLGVVTIVVNRQLTSVLALIVAVVLVWLVHIRARWFVVAGTALLLFFATVAVLPTLRPANGPGVSDSRIATYQQLSTYRLGAWAAALEMIRVQPLTGFGPGSYARLSQPYRLAAELRLHERLTPPPTANAFVVAHQDYLQLAAEAGVPALSAVLVALGVLLSQLLQRARSQRCAEALGLLAILVTGAVAALAWFPMQIMLTAVLLLLALGRAWRVIAEPERPTP